MKDHEVQLHMNRILFSRYRYDFSRDVVAASRLCFVLLILCFAQELGAQAAFPSSRSSVVLSNGLSGASEKWISLSAPSGLGTNYRLLYPTTAPSVNQQMVVSSISGSDYQMGWTNATNITGSGTATQIAYWTSGSTLSSNSSLYWDNTNKRLGVNTSSPSARIHSIVTNSSSSLLSLSSSNRTLLSENTTNGGVVGIQFKSRNNVGSVKTMNVGVDPTMLGGTGAFGIIPDGVSDGGLLIELGAGNVLIGSTVSGSSLPNKLAVNGNMSIGTSYRENTAPADGLIIQGDVGIGTNSPSNQLTVYNGTSTGNYTTTGWTHSSDRRLKNSIEPLHNALDKVRQLQGVSFLWKNLPDQHRQIGFIAQDVEGVVPEVVETDPTGLKSMAYQNLSALHNEAIKELDARVTSLETSASSSLATRPSTASQFRSTEPSVDVHSKGVKETALGSAPQLEDQLMVDVGANQTVEYEYILVVNAPSSSLVLGFEGMIPTSNHAYIEWSTPAASGGQWMSTTSPDNTIHGSFAGQELTISIKGTYSNAKEAMSMKLWLGSIADKASTVTASVRIQESSTLRTTILRQ